MLLLFLIFSLVNCSHLVYRVLKLEQTTKHISLATVYIVLGNNTKHNMVAAMVKSGLV